MSLLEKIQAIQNNLSRLVGIEENDFDTSEFSGSGAMGNIRSLQNALGGLLGNGGSGGGSIAGSVGRGGANNANDVRLVQQLLNQKANAGLAVDGLFGPKTLAAIVAYQESIFSGWSDGVIDPGGKTIQSLTGGSTSSAPDTGSNTSTGDGLSGSVGQGGDNNAADVRRVQQLLNGKGAELSVDGKIGPQTIGAIRAFQSANGIPTDGLIEPGRNTWKNLTGSGADIDTSSTPPSGGTLAPGQKPSTSNFSFLEFVNEQVDPDLHLAVPYYPNILKVMQQLEVIRAELGAPLVLTSGYRSPVHNRNEGGEEGSRHTFGQAADFYCPSVGIETVWDTVDRLMQQGKIIKGGLGKYPKRRFCHYDIRGSYTPFWGE